MGAPGGARGPNRFHLARQLSTVIEPFDPASPPSYEQDGLDYTFGIARELDRLLPDRGLDFFFTWHLDLFDERLAGCVAVLHGDEMYQVPRYSQRVRAIFKTGGTARNPVRQTVRLSPAVAWRVLLREARNVVRSASRRLQGVRRGAPMHEIPLGYYRLRDVEPIPFDQRTTDVFFAGSIEPKGWTVRPRLASRRLMDRAVKDLAQSHPRLRIDHTRSGPFVHPTGMLSAEEYSQRLASARLVLCPRGNFDETYRLFEAARAGVVAVAERLPERWYYDGAPVVQIDRWTQLPRVLDTLLAAPDELAERARAMRTWWDEVLSEQAIARFIAERLEADQG